MKSANLKLRVPHCASARRRVGVVAGIAIWAAVLAGCAATPTGTPRTMQPDDFKMLAGTWLGTAYVQGTAAEAIQGVIQDSGAFYIVPRVGGGTQRPGMMKIADGKVTYEMPTSKGSMTFEESSTAWIWRWQGTATDGSAVRHELTKPK